MIQLRASRLGRAEQGLGKGFLQRSDMNASSGEGGIRTLERVSPLTVFETVPINHSGTSPRLELYRLGPQSGRSRYISLNASFRQARASSPRACSTTTPTHTSLVLIMLMLMPRAGQRAEHRPGHAGVRPHPHPQHEEHRDVRVAHHAAAGVDARGPRPASASGPASGRPAAR